MQLPWSRTACAETFSLKGRQCELENAQSLGCSETSEAAEVASSLQKYQTKLGTDGTKVYLLSRHRTWPRGACSVDRGVYSNP